MKLLREKGVDISPNMIGLFFEDINFAADGGLYAEMIENRSFEAKRAFGVPGTFAAVDDPGYAWSPVADAKGNEPEMLYVLGAPLSPVNPHYLRIVASGAGQGFANKAYDGIYMKPDMAYHVSFYARRVTYEGEGVKVAILKDGKEYSVASVSIVRPLEYLPFCDTITMMHGWDPSNEDHFQEMRRENAKGGTYLHEWVKYECELLASEEVRNGQFTILLDGMGAIEFDLISMMPDDAVAGIFRKDLFEALKAIKPGFIRFPGGCIVEGISLDNGYRWKETVGNVKDRRYKMNLWAFQDDRNYPPLDTMRLDAHYGQSYGIGFYEYFLLCEMLGAKPLPIVGLGLACQFRTTELVDVGTKEFDEYIQDALDLIEFANGPIDSKWGSLRAKMGHKESFNLELLGVGNEQWETFHVNFYERASLFEKTIHEKYPDINIIGSCGPVWDSPITGEAWDFYRDQVAKNAKACYASDEHYYVSPQWMYDHVDMYDAYPRDVAVFAGEYAAHTKDRENNMEAALAEAALITGFEKNADLVKLASYAPLFNRIGHSQWKPDMIWFDDKEVKLTPNYYVQKMYGNHLGDYTLRLDESTLELRKDGVYVSASETKEGQVILKLVNTKEEAVELPLTDEKGDVIKVEADIWMLNDTTLCDEKSSRKLDGCIAIPAKTFAVIRF